MTDERQVYSDEEFALILRKASELANRVEPHGHSSSGLTLAEMKAAAAQAGLDPVLVERAARMLRHGTTTSPFERLIGGPLRHTDEARFPLELDEPNAARLLSAIRIAASQAGSRDAGHSSAMGMTWHDGGELEALSVTARPDADGTTVSVALDRRATLVTAGFLSGMASFFVLLFAVFALYPEDPTLSFVGGIAGVGGIFAAARAYWASSTRRVQERIGAVMDVIGQALEHREPPLDKAPLKVVVPTDQTSTID